MIIKNQITKHKEKIALVVLVISGLSFLSSAAIQYLSEGLVKDVYFHAFVSFLMLYGASHVDQLFKPISMYMEDDQEVSDHASFYFFLAFVSLIYWLVF